MGLTDSGAPRRLLFVVSDTPFFLSHRLPVARGAQEQGRDVSVAAPAGEGVNESRAVLIRGSGVDLSDFSASPEPKATVLVVLAARTLRQKGTLEFVEAARILRSKGKVARFVLVGPVEEGNASSLSETTLTEFVGDGAIECWGAPSDMPDVLLQAHIVCLPSHAEGVLKVLLEAAAVGRPIVTTDVPGCREVVEHGVNGLLVAPRNAAALAAGLGELISNPSLRSEMGVASRAKAEREFSVQAVVAASLETYDDVTGSIRARSAIQADPMPGRRP